ncbi:hypothetical protein [Lysinibacillus fusiformis]|uniref:hypothetical protein n=1 Tax=Lysinibacillus fusiformis TaxID=28031 RepID=UPI0011A8074F|nr:hypothetical protein [Lysinibacillus fusiformis]
MQDLDNYKEYFKTEEQLQTKTAYSIDETVYQIQKESLELYLLTKGFKYSNAGEKYVISSAKYEVHLVLLPSGDFAYYTINRKTKQKANYNQAFKFSALTHQFNKLGIL